MKISRQGLYCGDSPSIDPSGPCEAGYFCSGGAADITPLNDSISINPSGMFNMMHVRDFHTLTRKTQN